MNSYSHLNSWGWDLFFELQIENKEDELKLARVIGQERDLYRVTFGESTSLLAQVSGRFRHDFAHAPGAFPAVGDWVLCRMEEHQDKALIQKVLDRRTCFYRRDPGQGVQVVAANVDVVFIVTSLNRDLNVNRLDRYLSIAWDSGASPVIVLSKADLVEDAESILHDLENTYIGVPIYAVSVFEPQTCEGLRKYLKPGKTAVLMGSSGVGKSTLTNFFLGEEVLKTQSAREDDDRGRHTTTSRALFRLKEGAVLMDTPGMRQLGLHDQEEGVQELFSDILSLSAQCKFRDCAHNQEPGCAIQNALSNGDLDPDRWESYLKLQKEASYQERRLDPAKMAEEKKRWKKIHLDAKVHMARKSRGEI
ncbi:GTPase [Bdellovibrio bacteriovorus]|uniref:Small ribosomal subunit biogenesis GTPase RsgA n=1 Tax=Bdellovibrio bacteriovorus TaxID=959 RepID=A0A150WCI9_BDEBC|nr:ribosome small subunit-dependent GTPase A [Bdellovibrio bacteriovorus]KYG60619.1 GTPase [Bdellovibrio bacteriovorus]